jgi:hypothetical protein
LLLLIGALIFVDRFFFHAFTPAISCCRLLFGLFLFFFISSNYNGGAYCRLCRPYFAAADDASLTTTTTTMMQGGDSASSLKLWETELMKNLKAAPYPALTSADKCNIKMTNMDMTVAAAIAQE